MKNCYSSKRIIRGEPGFLKFITFELGAKSEIEFPINSGMKFEIGYLVNLK